MQSLPPTRDLYVRRVGEKAAECANQMIDATLDRPSQTRELHVGEDAAKLHSVACDGCADGDVAVAHDWYDRNSRTFGYDVGGTGTSALDEVRTAQRPEYLRPVDRRNCCIQRNAHRRDVLGCSRAALDLS